MPNKPSSCDEPRRNFFQQHYKEKRRLAKLRAKNKFYFSYLKKYKANLNAFNSIRKFEIASNEKRHQLGSSCRSLAAISSRDSGTKKEQKQLSLLDLSNVVVLDSSQQQQLNLKIKVLASIANTNNNNNNKRMRNKSDLRLQKARLYYFGFNLNFLRFVMLIVCRYIEIDFKIACELNFPKKNAFFTFILFQSVKKWVLTNFTKIEIKLSFLKPIAPNLHRMCRIGQYININ